MKKVSPSIDEINRLRGTIPSGPVVILNMVKFKDKCGKREFLSYLEAISTVTPPGGIDLFYSGIAYSDIAAGEEWDYVGLARYASFEEFADFVTSPTYQDAGVPHRNNALEKAIFMITQHKSLDDYLRAE